MRHWHKGTVVEFIKHKKHHDKDVKKAGTISYYKGDADGYHENDMHFNLYKDGSISFSDENIGESFIYLYPEQVIILKKLLLEG